MRYAIFCLGFIACTADETDNKPAPTSFTDEDGDGYLAGADCDDADASIHPGADEFCDLVDNDCDGDVDEDPVDGTEAWQDSDGDTYGDDSSLTITTCAVPDGWTTNGGDCDDTDSAINPGAAEVCDRADNDCDGKEDNDPVDASTFYIDADLDGYGSSEDTLDACSLPAGYSDNDDDCDDGNPRTSPAADEIACDGDDNNCDGRTDSDVVPRDHDSLQSAIDAVEDGGTICLSSGTYSDSLDLTGRRLTIVGQDGPRSTRFNIGSSWPQVTVGSGGNVTFQDISLQSAELVLADTVVQGGFARVTEGALSLQNVLVSDAVVALSGDSVLQGLLVYGETADISLSGLQIDGASFSFEDASEASVNAITGGMVAGEEGSTIDLYDVQMTNTTVSSSVESSDQCDLTGLLAANWGGDFTGSLIDVSALAVDLSCTAVVAGGVLASLDGSETVTGLSVTDTTVALSGLSPSLQGPLVAVIDPANEGTHEWSAVDVSGNTVTVTNDLVPDSSLGTAVFRANDVLLDHYTAYGNDTQVSGTSSAVMGGALYMQGSGTLSHIDLRANSTSAPGGASASGAYLSTLASPTPFFTLTNVIAAGNSAESDTSSAMAGGLLFAATSDDSAFDLTNADIVSNTASSFLPCSGAGLSLVSDLNRVSFTVTNTTFQGNACTSDTSVQGQAVYVENTGTDSTVQWAYNNLYEHDSDTVSGIEDPTDTDGNIDGDPKYVSTSGGSSTWDLRPTVRSETVDMGDPAVLDADGTVSDIGAYGGPAGDDW